jgi:ATP-binding cassette subfamily F protein 3
MINIHNLSVSFNATYLFNDASFKLNAGDRVGLIGKNGAGKSTMLNILSQRLEPDTGVIAFDKDLKIGFLRQDIDFEQGRTVLDEVYLAFTEIKKTESQLDQFNQELIERTDYESQAYLDIIQQISDLTHLFEILGGYSYKGDAERILQGLGFRPNDFNKLTDTFSGGWRMRIELAKLLLQKNDILLLDEPTNHLDIESIVWFENFLKSFPGVVVLVSHDKMFLDNVTNRTIEISLGRIYDYNQPYSKFLVLRNEIREKQFATQKNQQKKIEETEKLIDKFRAKASKASMAQSLMKKLDKIEIIEVDEEDSAVMNINFPLSRTPGRVVVEIDNCTKNYDDHVVFENIYLAIERGKKMAFVGQNGQGKSTLAKAIAKEIKYSGHIQLGHHVDLGYFAQNQSEYLDGEKTLLQTMEEAATDTNRSKVRDMLGAFLFRGDDVEKKVKVLSGGERNRLALCKLLLKPINVLLLDEPTNHLDIKSKNVLKNALNNFEGTLIIVSHDRDFLDGLVDVVYEFQNKNIKEYLGGINFFLESKTANNMREFELKKNNNSTTEIKVETKKETTISPESQKKIKTLNNQLGKIENNIQLLEKEISILETQMSENVTEDALNELLKTYEMKKKNLKEKMLAWEEIALAVDSI